MVAPGSPSSPSAGRAQPPAGPTEPTAAQPPAGRAQPPAPEAQPPAPQAQQTKESQQPKLARVAEHQPAASGWHLTEWGCEFLGTALLLLGGLSAICLDFGPGSPVASVVPSHSWRLLITGLLFASTGSAVTVSPLGRRSGAHLNPAVTLAFWFRRHVHPHDLAGYTIAQVLGALAGTEIVRLAWGSTARAVSLGVTQPGLGLDAVQTALVEALMTAILVGTILAMVSSPRTARWTPLVLIPLIAVLVWQGAPYTGTSLNPARSVAPAVLFPELRDLWTYVAGPLLGAAVAVGVFSLVPEVETLTAKLYHDPRYPSTMRTALVADSHVV